MSRDDIGSGFQGKVYPEKPNLDLMGSTDEKTFEI
jgi:hypothetical protein